MWSMGRFAGTTRSTSRKVVVRSPDTLRSTRPSRASPSGFASTPTSLVQCCCFHTTRATPRVSLASLQLRPHGAGFSHPWRRPPLQRLLPLQKQQLILIQRRSNGKRFHSTASSTASASSSIPEAIPEPAYKDLRLLAFTTSIPFVGFGIMDNAILIIAGDYIDATLGIYLGMSTLCAAAIGNIISDLFGIGFGTVIEDFCATRLKLPVPNITSVQRTLRSVRAASNIGMAIGMTVGCIIGMFPLFFIDSSKVEQKKKKAQLEHLFQDVVQEAKTLIDAESTCLYVRVHLDPKEEKEQQQQLLQGTKGGGWPADSTLMEHFHPDVEGDYFYAMRYDVPDPPSSSSSSSRYAHPAVKPSPLQPAPPQKETGKLARTVTTNHPLNHKPTSRLIPIGKGIISRAALTGEAWVISDLTREPDFLPALQEQYGGDIPDHLKHMVVVPVLDGQGRTLAVIRALNKVSPTTTTSSSSSSLPSSSSSFSVKNGFTDADVRMLKNLASHISVNLQGFFRDQGKEEMRLRDTIRLLKQHGSSGGGATHKSSSGFHGRPLLFPSNDGD